MMPTKTIKKMLIIVMVILALVIISWTFFINMGVMSGTVEKAYIYEIKKDLAGIKEYGVIDYDLSKEQIKRITSKPEDFLILEYHFKLENRSSWKKIWKVKLKPKFPDKIKNIILFYRKKEYDGLVTPIFIDRNNYMVAQKRIIIMKKFLNEEFYKLINKVKFKATGKIVISKKQVDFITIGYCSTSLKYSDNFVCKKILMIRKNKDTM